MRSALASDPAGAPALVHVGRCQASEDAVKELLGHPPAIHLGDGGAKCFEGGTVDD